MKQIIVDFDAVGNVSISAEGFQGSSCEKATEELELHLGGDAKKSQKPEYHMPDTTSVDSKLTF